jgi:hypothetical protein
MSDHAIEEEVLRGYWCFEEINRYRRITADHYIEFLKKELLHLRTCEEGRKFR